MQDDKVFSTFEVKEFSIRDPKNEKAADRLGCVGSCDETLNTKTITKKCEGAITKQRTKGDGTASVTISLHIRAEHFYDLHGMNSDILIEGVHGFGENSVLPERTIAYKGIDEDGRIKYKAYPRFTITEANNRKVENGGEEVQEIEIKGTALSDDNGFCMYEALESELKDSDAKTKWLTNFTSALVKVKEI